MNPKKEKRYAVIIYANNPANVIEFNSVENLYEIIHRFVDSFVKRIKSNHTEKESSLYVKEWNCGNVNEKATYYADIPLDEDIRGTAILVATEDDYIVGYTEDEATEICKEINNL